MKRYLPLAVTPLLLVLAAGCNNKGSQSDTTQTTGGTVPAAPATALPSDNTGVNARDTTGAMTPLDQGNQADDLQTTQEIRKALIDSDSLSADAKNVKIITNGGIVTLRGPVRSDAERATVEMMARKAAETDRIVNELDVEAK